jgi:hypothetical protein
VQDVRLPDFKFQIVEAAPAPCSYAAAFMEWAEALVTSAVATHDLVSVTEAKLLLQERYWQYYSVVPKRHREMVSSRGNHLCLFAVYQSSFDALQAETLSLKPPVYYPRVGERPEYSIDHWFKGTVLGDREVVEEELAK